MKNKIVQNELEDALAYTWEWPAVIGIFLMLLGVAVVGVPAVATIGISWLMGIAFIASGLAQLLHAFRLSTSHGWVGRVLLAALSIVAGVITLRNPMAGAVGLTLVLAFYLLFGSIARGIVAFESKNVRGRGWLIFSSVVSFCFGFYLLVTFTESSLIIPGTLLGLDLIFYGVSLTFMSAKLQKVFEEKKESIFTESLHLTKGESSYEHKNW